MPQVKSSLSTAGTAALARQTLLAIWKYVHPHRLRFFFSMVLGMLSGAFYGFMMISFQLIFSLVLRGQTTTLGEPRHLPLVGEVNLAKMFGLAEDTPVGLNGVMLACACVPLLIFVRGFLGYLSSYMQAWVTSRVVYDIRNDAYRSVMRQSPGFFNSARTGELMQTVTNQTSVVQRNAMMLVQTIAQRPVAIVGLLVPIFAKDWFFALMSLVVFPLCLLPIVRLGKRVRKVGAQEEYDSRALMSVMQETFSGIRLVKAYCREDHETAKFERTNLSMTRNMVKWAKAIELIGPIVEAVASLGIAAGLVYAWKQGMGADDFFLLVFGLTQIYPPIKELSRVQLLLQKTTVAASMVFEILNRQPDIKDAPSAALLGRAKGEIGFHNVTFYYRDPHGTRIEPPAASGITLKLEPGKFYAVVGPSAAGKSTLFNLLLRFYDPDSGVITLDGTDIKTVTQASLRENVGLVSQDTFIFHDTLRENIRYGRLGASEEQIVAAAKKAHAHEFIMQIKGRYDASAGEGGRNLSGGQKQRLSIARAMLHDAPVLLLDEATSALDTESEKVIQDAIHSLSEGKTVIAIAHRLSTVLAAHQIIVMDAGRVVAVGSNEELLRTSPLYQRLHSLQFGTEHGAGAS
jgi:subfamily B ATP-binding cassette protein MsbA